MDQVRTSAREEVLTGLVAVDVLPLIFKEVYADWFGRPRLLRLALTCNAFREPALDILWRNLDNLAPLLRLLPLSRFSDDGQFFLLEPTLSERCQNRVNYYRHRIRLITTLSERFGGVNFLLPSLRVLRIHANDKLGTIVPVFLSSSLRTVTITGRITPPIPLVPLIHKFAPSLKTLDLDNYFDPLDPRGGSDYNPIIAQITAFTFLQCLTIQSVEGWRIGRKALATLLSSMSMLTSLGLTVDTFTGPPFVERWDDLLNRLDYFKLALNPKANAGMEIYDILPFATVLRIRWTTAISRGNISTFFSHVGRWTRLQSLIIDASGTQEQPLVISLNDIHSVLISPSLQILEFQGHMHLRDTVPAAYATSPGTFVAHRIVSLLVASSPFDIGRRSKLQALRLPYNITPTPSFECLELFAGNNSGLEALGLGLDSRISQSSWGVKPNRPFKNSIKRLTIFERRPTAESEPGIGVFDPLEYTLLAKQIHSWFPNLELLEGVTHYRHWSHIDEIREMIKRTEALKNR
ncbi:hypothetical protein BKA70DRAFT_1307654 [Coprinopsis sp. MPI-PUGE-AT-0042]|nr:hypothetical protein BKA70DRAFT_1307654 [Coprinopsis sp. MPI-PUGE-AT-0042]